MPQNAIHITKAWDNKTLNKGIYLSLLHADKIPPHIGLLIDRQYHSLTIKGHELNIPANVFLKNIALRKIPTVFIQIKKHPVFSNLHLSEAFVEQVKQFDKVGNNENTCLSPIKLFFEEFYAIPKKDISLVFDLLEQLQKNEYMQNAMAIHILDLKKNIFYLQSYNKQHLDEQIRLEKEKVKA